MAHFNIMFTLLNSNVDEDVTHIWCQAHSMSANFSSKGLLFCRKKSICSDSYCISDISLPRLLVDISFYSPHQEVFVMTLPATTWLMQDESTCCLTFKLVECRKRRIYQRGFGTSTFSPLGHFPEWQESYLSTISYLNL